MIKLLAKHAEISEPRWIGFMNELNDVARRGGLAEYKTYSRVWEYPWLWFQLEDSVRSLRILDIGSERSAYPWLLAEKGIRCNCFGRDVELAGDYGGAHNAV